ncbi:MAG: hypothetical protein MPN21_18340 [Thermoanaerobaculia bacterium]|nr:hypothetical protein [Thermoanaerobaculia bacterium]
MTKSPAVVDSLSPDSQPGADDAHSMAVNIIRSQPADASLDDILRALGFHRVIERGLADAAAGRLMSQETFRRKLRRWLG